jgi:hypothetical protein
MLTSFRQQVVAVVVEQVAAVAAVRQQVVVAVVEQAVVAVVERVAAVQRVFVPLQAVQQAFAGKTLPTELCLLLQVAIAFSFCLPPNEFCSFILYSNTQWAVKFFMEAVLKIYQKMSTFGIHRLEWLMVRT